MSRKKAYLVLADGSVLEGFSFGADSSCVGELVFTTNMCGYIETLIRLMEETRPGISCSAADDENLRKTFASIQFPYGSPPNALADDVDTSFASFSFIVKIRFVLYLFIIHELRIFEPEVRNLLAHFYLCEN